MKARTIAFALAWTLPSLALAQGIPLPAKEVSLSLSAFVNAPAKDGAGLTVTNALGTGLILSTSAPNKMVSTGLP